MPFLRSFVVAMRVRCPVSCPSSCRQGCAWPPGGTAVQSSDRYPADRIERWTPELSAPRPTVSDMDTNGIPARLRLVTENPDPPHDGEAPYERSSLSAPRSAGPVSDRRREDYWAQVQALRADLASLRLAN